MGRNGEVWEKVERGALVSKIIQTSKMTQIWGLERDRRRNCGGVEFIVCLFRAQVLYFLRARERGNRTGEMPPGPEVSERGRYLL